MEAVPTAHVVGGEGGQKVSAPFYGVLDSGFGSHLQECLDVLVPSKRTDSRKSSGRTRSKSLVVSGEHSTGCSKTRDTFSTTAECHVRDKALSTS